jgi:hypothetical protein
MDNLVNVLGILGAYFAVLLVLAVSVETILDPFTILIKPLRKKVSPEDAIKDIKEWLPDKSKAQTNAIAIANFVKEFNTEKKNITDRVNEIGAIANDTVKALGIAKQAAEAQKQLAIRIFAIRSKYSLDEEKRIVFVRMLSAFVGIVLALILQIDTFQLLSGLFGKEALQILFTPVAHIGGMLLTGFAASAGSSFWHDQLVTVRATKEEARRVQELTAK